MCRAISPLWPCRLSASHARSAFYDDATALSRRVWRGALGRVRIQQSLQTNAMGFDAAGRLLRAQ